MNIVLLLDWSRVNIDRQVAAANQRMTEMTKSIGLDHKVLFNLASMGAGEWMTDMPWIRVSGDEEKEKLQSIKMDAIRRFHWRVKNEFEKDMTVRVNRETREMLSTLKRRGHKLSLVWKDDIDQTVSHLVYARSLEYFESQLNDVLFGKLKSKREGSLEKRIGLEVLEPRSTMVVTDFPEGVEAGKKLRESVVVGYIPSNQDFDEKGRQLKNLTAAGADYALIGGHTVSTVPDVLFRQSVMKKIMAGIPGLDV